MQRLGITPFCFGLIAFTSIREGGWVKQSAWQRWTVGRFPAASPNCLGEPRRAPAYLFCQLQDVTETESDRASGLKATSCSKGRKHAMPTRTASSASSRAVKRLFSARSLGSKDRRTGRAEETSRASSPTAEDRKHPPSHVDKCGVHPPQATPGGNLQARGACDSIPSRINDARGAGGFCCGAGGNLTQGAIPLPPSPPLEGM